jgi:hypothetical protein
MPFPSWTPTVRRARLHCAVAGVVLALGSAPPPAWSQSAGTLEGRVEDARTGAPVPEVYVSIPSLRRGAFTGAAGEFRLTELPAGTHRVSFRRVGYAETERTLVVSGEGAEVHVVVLEPSPVEVDGLVVVGGRRVPPRMEPFERRRLRPMGSARFMDREELERHANRDLRDVIRTFSGAQITPSTYSAFLSSNRSQAAGALRGPPRPCYAQVFMDGVRLNGPIDLNSLRVLDLEAVEYYPGPASTPPEFRTQTAQCGTLVLWTRDR